MDDLFGGLNARKRAGATRPSRGSKYTPLSVHLREQRKGTCTLRFGEIEEIIQAELPRTAKARRTGSLCWGNDAIRTQAKHGWLCVGWQTAKVDYSEECVFFVRAEE